MSLCEYSSLLAIRPFKQRKSVRTAGESDSNSLLHLNTRTLTLPRAQIHSTPVPRQNMHMHAIKHAHAHKGVIHLYRLHHAFQVISSSWNNFHSRLFTSNKQNFFLMLFIKMSYIGCYSSSSLVVYANVAAFYALLKQTNWQNPHLFVVPRAGTHIL